MISSSIALGQHDEIVLYENYCKNYLYFSQLIQILAIIDYLREHANDKF
jgi:hypothetical protein